VWFVSPGGRTAHADLGAKRVLVAWLEARFRRGLVRRPRTIRTGRLMGGGLLVLDNSALAGRAHGSGNEKQSYDRDCICFYGRKSGNASDQRLCARKSRPAKYVGLQSSSWGWAALPFMVNWSETINRAKPFFASFEPRSGSGWSGSALSSRERREEHAGAFVLGARQSCRWEFGPKVRKLRYQRGWTQAPTSLLK
jgi:hypothetical protein